MKRDFFFDYNSIVIIVRSGERSLQMRYFKPDFEKMWKNGTLSHIIEGDYQFIEDKLRSIPVPMKLRR